ncbi:hypothetical protein [Allomesorhizobium camelthorni]|uniref:Uncharacterized protein n=1 Tax=Allomesorhizobium camelthorni TaxID=475069 RepID=A0A6G4W6Q1_9HYPH|nr:hypothetical protein [Mesorhizobium camelthorni]NGO50431.1 hypothetical protein [Mesorhizobium camelthorni]
MAIRLRDVGGIRVALCAAETDAKPGDVYLDDADHYALAAKFASDWEGRSVDWQYPREWAAMATQKLRDGETELNRWLAEQAA